MQEWAQWWLVITSPSAETKLAEQPWARRAEDRRTCSSQASSTLTPYFCLTLSLGKLLKVHIPSSARAGVESRTPSTRNAAVVFMVAPPRGGPAKLLPLRGPSKPTRCRPGTLRGSRSAHASPHGLSRYF